MLINMILPGAVETARLPKEYQEVEYIQSSGTQYINTGFVPSYSTRVVMRAIVQDYSANGAFFGARTSSSLSGLSYSLILLAGGAVRSDYYGTEVNVTTAPLGQEFEIDKNKNVCTVNGATATNTASTSSSAYPLYLFAVNTAGTASLFGKLRLSETQIYDNGTLKLHYVPCYRKADTVVGLYDILNDVFYANAGTGTFTKGADVSGGGSSSESLEFTYSGNYTDNRVNGIGTVTLNTSGTLTVTSGTAMVSAYILGGGGGGAQRYHDTTAYRRAAGGGSGGVQTQAVTLAPGTYEIVIGVGGAGAYMETTGGTQEGAAGGDTIAFGYTSTGGKGGNVSGSGLTATVTHGAGGSPDGNNGIYSGALPNGGPANGGSAAANSGGDGYVELTFI